MLKIRKGRSTDLQAVSEIHVASWQSAYRGMIPDAILDALTVEGRLASWQAWSDSSEWPNVHLTVAERDGQLIGFCRLGPVMDRDNPPTNFAEVTHLYVAPGQTGRGVGHALFTDALEQARGLAYDGLLLWVLEQNNVARQFYSSHGLHFDGARHTEPAWLGDGVYEVRYRIVFPRAAA